MKLAKFFKTKMFIPKREKVNSRPFEENPDLRNRGNIKKIVLDNISTALVFLLVYITLFIFFKPTLLLSQTTTCGGDTGSHNYVAKFFIEELLPHYRMSGWTMDWYAGMPILTFYFPFPYLLISLQSKLIPYTLAFKLVTVLGTFLLPFSAYHYGKLLRFKSPFPELAAILATAFLFMKSYSIYGGNILSTLAGEFSYSLSFSLVFIFIGTLYRGTERASFDWLFLLNCLILTIIILSHTIPFICLLLITPGLLTINRRWRAIGYIVAVFSLGFLLTAFWTIPFLDKLHWTTNMWWTKLQNFNDIFPSEIRPVTAIAVIGMIYSFRKKDIRARPLFWNTLILIIAFFSLSGGLIWNARILPFLFFSIYLWAAYGLFSLSDIVTFLFKDLFAIPANISRRFFATIIAATVAVAIIFSNPTAASWIRWNYEGFEAKPDWPQYKQINEYINKLPPGRVMNEEDNNKIDKFGTPRAFELIPYWTNKPAMEGLLVEGSFTSLYHFINQAEISPEPASGISGVNFPSLNISRGITHLQLMNVRYLIVSSPDVAKEVANDQRTKILTKIGDYSIFEISGSNRYVEVMKNWPVRVTTDDWRTTILLWYLNESDLQVPIIWDRGERAIKEFNIIDTLRITDPPTNPIDPKGDVIKETINNQQITFETTAIGYPHLIKVSYFPNWHAEGADGPFVVSPSFMMVIPRQRKVTLTYLPTTSDIVGSIITIFGWLLMIALLIINSIKTIVYHKHK
jgi:hypothetical protein